MLVGVGWATWKRGAYAGCYADYDVPAVVEGVLEVSEVFLILWRVCSSASL
jgi:hypothetical protein